MIAKQGVIFEYSAFRHSGESGEAWRLQNLSARLMVQGDSGLLRRSLIARMTVFVGNFLIFLSVLGVFVTIGPLLFYEAKFRLSKAHLGGAHSATSEVLRRSEAPSEVSVGTREKILVPKDTSFRIIIPKLGLNEKVFANIDASDKNEYSPILQKGAAHAKGTYFPGQDGNIYIFAHSGENFWDGVKFNNIFYLLKDLKPKDEIVIFFNNKLHNYTVEKLQIADSSETSFITQPKTGKEQLILQTCWPPLTTWNRLLVFAKPI